MSHICQFIIPGGVAPEQFINECLTRKDDGSEVVEAAKRIVAVANTHQYINDIVIRLGVGEDRGLAAVISKFAEFAEWIAYSSPIRDWVRQRKAALGIV